MADTDVFGILSLVLAAGGAAYLLRARFLSHRAWAPTRASSPPVGPGSDEGDRSAKTVPPRLRPASNPPKQKWDAPTKPHPDRWYRDDLAEAEHKKEVERRSSKSPVAAAPKSPPAPSGSTNAAPESKSVPASAPKSAPVPAAKSLPTPAPPPKSTPVLKSVPAPPPKSVPAPSSSPKVVPKPESTPTPKPKAAAPPTPKAPSSKPKIARIDAEEDEDVEPTRVGRAQVDGAAGAPGAAASQVAPAPAPKSEKVPASTSTSKPASKRREIQPPVERLVFDQDADGEAAAASIVVEVVAQTDPGRRRKQNEDAHLVLPDVGLFVVADGMGGHKGGQIASGLAIKAISEAFAANAFQAAPHPNLPGEASELARAVQMANAEILEEAGRRPEVKGMGTTICSIRLSRNHARLYIAHVGDSRCYRVRDGAMRQVTSDHTMASYGVTGPEGAHLSRAVGVWPTVPIDVLFVTPQVGDVYLLCSDGLTKMLPDQTIATQLLHEENLETAANRLVMFANAHGGKDNITVILLRITKVG